MLENGKIRIDDTSSNTISKYYQFFGEISTSEHTSIENSRFQRGSGFVRFVGISIRDGKNDEKYSFQMGSNIRFFCKFKVNEYVVELFLTISLRSGLSYEAVTSAQHEISAIKLNKNQIGEVIVELPQINLRLGEYPLYFWLGDHYHRQYDVVDNLTMPLQISACGGAEDLNFDPSQSSSFLMSNPSLLKKPFRFIL